MRGPLDPPVGGHGSAGAPAAREGGSGPARGGGPMRSAVIVGGQGVRGSGHFHCRAVGGVLVIAKLLLLFAKLFLLSPKLFLLSPKLFLL